MGGVYTHTQRFGSVGYGTVPSQFGMVQRGFDTSPKYVNAYICICISIFPCIIITVNNVDSLARAHGHKINTNN